MSIADVCAKFTSGGTPSRKKPEYFENGVLPWVKTKELSDAVLENVEEWITESAVAASSAKRLPRNTVLMAMYGATVGQLGVLGREMACNQACAAMIVDDTRCDYRFLYYQLLANRRQIVSMATGAAQQNLSGAQIKNWRIPLPSRKEQARITDLLWSLDERIALLRQTNTTLEAIAQALFKSWFVDFDPVHAKSEGREPEVMDAVTAALFPSEFEQSELGPIPKGWRIGTLTDLTDLNASKWTARKHPETVTYIDLSGVTGNRIDNAAEYPFEAAPSRARHHLRDGDTIVGTVRPGNRAFAYIHLPEPNLTGSTGFAVLSPKLACYASYVYLATTGDESIGRLANLADGAAYPAVRPGVVASTPCVIGTDDVIQAFSAVTQPMLERIGEGRRAAATLTKLRDTLLSRLISGKLRLPEAMEATQEALA